MMKNDSMRCWLTAAILTAAGCVGPAGAEVGTSTAALTATTEAMGAVGSLSQAATEVANEAAGPEQQGDDGGQPGPDGGAPSCVTLGWTIIDPLHLAIDLDECLLEGGQTIDGRLDGWLDYQGVPGAVGLGFDALTVGSHSLDGVLVGSAIQPDGTRFEVDVRLADAATQYILSIDGGVLESTPGRATLAGSGRVTDGPDGFDVTILQTLIWDDPSTCYPTAGRLSTSRPGEPALEAAFVVTPMGPAVDVQLEPPPAAPVRMALPPCGGSGEAS